MTIDFIGPAADMLDPALPADLAKEREQHPVPHPGCTRCDPAIVASVRAHVAGIRRTRPAGTPNRARVVLVEGAAMVVSVPERREAP